MSKRTGLAPGVRRDPQGPARPIHGETPLVTKTTTAKNPALVRAAGGKGSGKAAR